MAEFKDSAKYVLKRMDNAVGNYAPHSAIESALYNIREDRTQYSVDTKSSVKNNKKDVKAGIIGIGAAISEAALTLPLLIKANSLSFNVKPIGDKLYRISPWGELGWLEKAVYPLVDTKIAGVLPATTALWASFSIATGLVTYYLAHRKLKD